MAKQLFSITITSKKIRFLLLPLLMLFAVTHTNGQGTVSGTWVLTSNSSGAAGGASTTLSVGTMAIGSEFSPGNYSSSGFECQSGVVWPTVATTTPGYYLDFPISPATGYDLTLSAYSAILKTSGSSNQSEFSFSYALDGSTTFTQFVTPFGINSGGTTTVATTSFSSITCPNGHTMVVRVFIYAGSGGNSASRNVYVKSFVLSGTTAVAAASTPTVTSTPTNQTVCGNGAATTVVFSGSPVTGTAYNWTSDNTAIGIAASGTGNVSFNAVNNTTAAITAHITVTPVAGAVSGTAKVDTIVVGPATGIINQSYSKNVWAGDNTTFSVVATGTAPIYQWQYSTGGAYANVPNAAPYSGVTGSTLIITSATTAMNGYTYQCTVTGTCGVVTSTPNTLNIFAAPAITGLPCPGSTLTLNSTYTPGKITWTFNGNTVQTTTPGYIAAAGTIAGTGTGGAASNQLSNPAAIYVDGALNTYVADALNNRVQKFASGSLIGTTVAGTGTAGTGATQLSNPYGVFVDGVGNLYVSDFGNNRVQKFTSGSTTGVTVAGTGVAGTGTTQLSGPAGIFVDAQGNLYITDLSNNRIQKFAYGSLTGVTVAGTGTSGSGATQLASPASIFVDAYSNSYVADAGNNRIQKFASGSATGTTVAGTGTAGTGATQLSNPTNIFVDGIGYLYVADAGNNRIQKFAPGSTTGTTVAGTGTAGATATQLSGPVSVFADAPGNLYISDRTNARIQKFYNNITTTYSPAATGTYTATAIASDSTNITTAQFVVNANVGTPVFAAGSTSTRCQGAGTVTYTATATASTSITYALDATTLATPGNSINAITGAVTYAAGWNGTSTITVTAVGCSGSASATHTVTITPTVGTPVFNLPGAATRCQGAGTVTYNATATNTTGITYSLDAVTAAYPGNSINTATAAVTYAAGWSGTTTITATAAGCNGPSVSTYTATIYPTPTVVVSPVRQSVCNGAPTAAITFTGSVANTVFSWTNTQPSINIATASPSTGITSFSAVNTGIAPVTAVITVTPAANGCAGLPVNDTIVVNPTPTVTVSPTSQSVCNGAGTQAVTFGGTVSGTVYTWVNSASSINVITTSPSAGISSFTAANTGISPVTAVITVTPTANGCIGPVAYDTIVVKPTPNITLTSTKQSVCNGATSQAITFSSGVSGTIYTWTNSAPSINITSTSPGTGITPFAAVNNGNAPVTALITVLPTANGCPGAPATDTIIVNPTPNVALNITSQKVCNTATTQAIIFSGAVSGTTYTWTNTAPSINITSTSPGTGIAPFAAVNTNPAPVTAVITVMPTANGCAGPTANDTIIVNPTPTVTLTNNTQSVCNTLFTQTITFSGAVTGTTYSWLNNTTSINLAALGSGSGINAFQAVNTGIAPVTATITVTPAANGCLGLPQVATITVKPSPNVSSSPVSQTICTTAGSYPVVFSGTVANTVFHWANSNTTIGLGAADSVNIPSFIGINNSLVPVSGIITVTPVANGCTGPNQYDTITINPTPTVSASPAIQSGCNGDSTQKITFASTIGTTVFLWSNNNSSIGQPSTGSNNILPFQALNSGTAPVTAVFTVSPLSGSCLGIPYTFTVTVKPTPSVTATPANQPVCNTFTTELITFTGNITGTAFNWVNNTTSINLQASNTGNIPSFTAANTSNAPVTATITVTPVLNGCSGTPQNATITVNPTPTVTATPASQSFCHNAVSLPVIFNGPVANTSYAWANSNTTIGFSQATGTTNIPAFTGVNVTNAPVTATITVVPAANGCTGPSQVATITVNPIPAVTITPASQVKCNNTQSTNIVYTPTVSGTTYTWTNSVSSIGINNTGTGNIPQVTLLNAGNTAVTSYIGITPTANGCAGLTVADTIVVNPTPSVNPLTPQIVCNGGAVAPILFNGSLVSGTVYNWINSVPSIGTLASGVGNISGFNGANAGTTPVVATIAVTPVANGCNGALQSTTITVKPTPTVNISQLFQPVCNGAPTQAIVFSGLVNGATYPWTNNNPTIGLSAISPANIASFAAINTGYVPVLDTITVTPIANGCTGQAAIARITVNPTPGVTSSPIAQSVCNATPATIGFTSTVAGTAYTWVNNTPSINLSGSGTGNISFTAVNTNATPVTAYISVTPSANGCAGLQVTDTITVRPTPIAIIAAAANPLFCPTDSVRITANMGAGLTYQWQLNSNNIGGATRDTFYANPAGNYTAVVTNNYNCPTVSNIVTVTHLPAPAALITPAGSTTLCQGDSVLLNANTGSGITYVWKLNGIYISAANSSSYMAHVPGTYVVYETDGTCNATTPAQTVSVTQLPQAVITANGPAYFCTGSAVTLTADAGTTANYTYQYMLNNLNINGTTQSYAASAAGNYSVKVTNSAGCNNISSYFPVGHLPTPADTVTYNGSAAICTGDSLMLVADTGFGYAYQWQENGSALAGVTTIAYTVNTAGSYSVKITGPNGCTATTTPVVVTTTQGPVAIATATGATTVCAPATVTLNAATGAGYSYQWLHDGDLVTGATSATYTTATSGSYAVRVSNTGCSIASTAIPIAINTLPKDSMHVFAPGIICQGGGSVLLQGASGAGYTYQWQYNGNNIAGATAAFYTALQQGDYAVQITNAAGCSITTAPASLATAATPSPVIVETGNQLCVFNYNTYQWYLNNIPIPNGNGPCITPVTGGGYTVAVTNAAGCAGVSPTHSFDVSVASVAAQQVKLYPNPATNVVNIDAPKSINATICSLDGKQLMYVEDAKTIDISTLSNTVYLIKLFDKDNVLIKVEKLVKTGW